MEIHFLNWLTLFQDIDHNTDYYTFKKKWGHDPRFEALDRKEREVLINERYHSMRVLPCAKDLIDVHVIIKQVTSLY